MNTPGIGVLRQERFQVHRKEHLSLSKSSLNRSALEFRDRVGGDPAGGFRIDSLDFLGHLYGSFVQVRISFPDIPQRPVDGFLHEIPIVRRSALYHRK